MAPRHKLTKKPRRVWAPTVEEVQEARRRSLEKREQLLINLHLKPEAEVDEFFQKNSHVVKKNAAIPESPLPSSSEFQLDFSDTFIVWDYTKKDHCLTLLSRAHRIMRYSKFIRSLITQFMDKGTLTKNQVNALQKSISDKQLENRLRSRRVEAIACPACGTHLGVELEYLENLKEIVKDREEQQDKTRFDKLL